MFGLFTPRPPLEVAGKALVERLLNVLAARLGPGRIGIDGPTPDTLLPSTELADFDDSDASDAAVAALVTRFADHLGLDAAGLRVEWFDERPLAAAGDSSFSLGTWRRDGDGPVIGLNASLRGDKDSLAATVAHELCHEVLLGRLSERERDSQAGQLLEEPLTDLACAGLGLGLFPANATVREGPVETRDGTAWGVRSVRLPDEPATRLRPRPPAPRPRRAGRPAVAGRTAAGCGRGGQRRTEVPPQDRRHTIHR